MFESIKFTSMCLVTILGMGYTALLIVWCYTKLIDRILRLFRIKKAIIQFYHAKAIEAYKKKIKE